MFSDKVVDVFCPFRQNDVVHSNLFVALQVAQVEVVRIDLKWIKKTILVKKYQNDGAEIFQTQTYYRDKILLYVAEN